MISVGWGEVVITRGRYAGRMGYYDDDDGLSGCAVVYLEGPVAVAPYVLVQKRSLRQATEAEAQRWHDQFNNEIVHARVWRNVRERMGGMNGRPA